MKMLRLLGAACLVARVLVLAFALFVAAFLMRVGRRTVAIAGAVLFVILLPGLAAAADAAASVSSTVIDFAPVVNAVLVPLLLALLGVLGTWVLTKLKTWLNLQNNDALSGVLETAMQNGLAFAQSKIPGLVPTAIAFDTKSTLIATAANYVIAHAPDTMKMLGVDQAALIQKLEARLSVNTTPAAQSIAVPTDPAAVRT